MVISTGRIWSLSAEKVVPQQQVRLIVKVVSCILTHVSDDPMPSKHEHDQ